MMVCVNGAFFPVEAPLLSVQNRGFKWGDGLFETMKVFQGRLLLQASHFERLFSGLQLLQMDRQENLTEEALVSEILSLCSQNKCTVSARVRLAVFRDDQNNAGYTIEAMPLPTSVNEWQEEGARIGLYPYARKATDAFANLKSASYLLYVLAQKFASDKGMDDALVLNNFNLLCDSARANIFLIKATVVYTPALHQGPVNGVMRRMVITAVKNLGWRMMQSEVSEEDLLSADEVFLTNAIQMLRWVKTYRDREYQCEKTKRVFDLVASTIFAPPC